MSDRIEEIRARWATEGWCVCGHRLEAHLPHGRRRNCTDSGTANSGRCQCSLPAHAPEDIAYLLAELEAARASNESPNHRPAAIDRAVAKLREQAHGRGPIVQGIDIVTGLPNGQTWANEEAQR